MSSRNNLAPPLLGPLRIFTHATPMPSGNGKSRPCPRAYTGRHGPNDYLFKIPLFIVRWAVGSNKGILYCCNLCKCVDWANVLHMTKILRMIPTSNQNPISIIISVVLVVLLENIKLNRFWPGPKRAQTGLKLKIELRAGPKKELRAGPGRKI